jgi:hypothetical protein
MKTRTSLHVKVAAIVIAGWLVGLPTKFAKMVVTDDRGRYLIPDLPSATYDVWVRGWGLVDSPKVCQNRIPHSRGIRFCRCDPAAGIMRPAQTRLDTTTERRWA